MNMIILAKKKINELKKINEENVHLNRAIQPVKLKDGSYALRSDILEDEGTWGKWIDFLSSLPQREVLDDEFDVPELLL